MPSLLLFVYQFMYRLSFCVCLEVPFGTDETFEEVSVVEFRDLDIVAPARRVHEAAVPNEDADVRDLVPRGSEEDQIAVFEFIPADHIPHPVLLARGARDVDATEVVDGPDKTAAVHAVHHGV